MSTQDVAERLALEVIEAVVDYVAMDATGKVRVKASGVQAVANLLREPSEGREPDAWISAADARNTRCFSRKVKVMLAPKAGHVAYPAPVYFGTPPSPEEPEGEAWRLERDYDAKNGTHRLTNGRAQLSVWTAEVNDPDLDTLEAQLNRGRTPSDSPTGEPDAKAAYMNARTCICGADASEHLCPQRTDGSLGFDPDWQEMRRRYFDRASDSPEREGPDLADFPLDSDDVTDWRASAQEVLRWLRKHGLTTRTAVERLVETMTAAPEPEPASEPDCDEPGCTSDNVRLRGWYSEEAGATVYGHYCDTHWCWSHSVPASQLGASEPAADSGEE